MTTTEKNIVEYESKLETVILELEKQQKWITTLEKRLCEQEDKLRHEINCLKQEICQLRCVFTISKTI